MPVIGMAQNTFLQVLNPANLTFSSYEQAKLTAITQMPQVLSVWHISIDNFQGALNGRMLTATLPNEVPISFHADFPYSKDANSFNWIGYNMDGSYFQFIKIGNEYVGNIKITVNGNHYGILSISPTKWVLVKYDSNAIEVEDDCSTLVDPASATDDDEVEDRFGCEVNVIRVLFLYTPFVEGGALSPTTVADKVISELNGTCMASGISSADATFINAGVMLLPGFVEKPEIEDDANDVCENSTAQSLRNSTYADLVILFTGDHPTGNAVGNAVGTTENKAYCAAEIYYADAGFTGTHELGHVLGANHQRCLTCYATSCEPDWPLIKAFGYKFGNAMYGPFRTMMATNGCDAERVTRWSNPEMLFMVGNGAGGFITGTNNDNNAKKVKRRAGKAACFRPNPPPSSNPGPTFLVSISGPAEVCNVQGYYPYQSSISSGQSIAYPLTYLWEISETGIYDYTTVSTTNTWLLTQPSTLPGTWTTVRLTVTDANNQSTFDFFQIYRITCLGGGKGGDDRSSSAVFQTTPFDKSGQIAVMPNPVGEQLRITGLSFGNRLDVLDLNGRVINSFEFNDHESTEALLDLSNLIAGMYFLSIKSNTPAILNKIKFVKL